MLKSDINNKLIFNKENFIYDNGIINFLLILIEIYGINGTNELEGPYFENNIYRFELNNSEYKIKIKLYDSFMEISGDNIKDLINYVFIYTIKTGNIIHFTKNDKYYWDIKNEKVVIGKKVDIEGGCQYFGYQVFKKYPDIKYKSGVLNEKLLIKEIEDFNAYNNLNIKLGDLLKGDYGINVLPTIEENINVFLTYSLNSDSDFLDMDSRSHPFEDGQKKFKDFLKNSKDSIGFFDSFFFQIGFRVKKYFINDYNYYFYSDSLIDLFDIKSFLKIPYEKIENNDKKILLPQNINFSELGKNNFFSTFEDDYELKVLLFIYNKFNILENQEKLFEINILNKNLSIYSYTDGELKSSLNYYQRVNKLFNFLEKLHNTKIRDGTDKEKSLLNMLFGYGGILSKLYEIKPDGNLPLLLNKVTSTILNFISLRKIFMTAQQDLLKNKKGTLPNGLKEFEDLYLKEIGRNDDIFLNELCFGIGCEIGRFLATVDDSSFIFKLRNIKNYKQLIGFINDFYFLLLKNSDNTGIYGEAKDYINRLLDVINPENREIIKDYLGIYIIQKYQNTIYAKSKKQD